MEEFKLDSKFLNRLLELKCERETVDYVLWAMGRVLGDDMPEAEQLRAYLMEPDKPTTLSPHQQMVAMDKLLECAEVNFRTVCDLFRYQKMKEAGMVNSVDEFLQLLHPDLSEEEQDEVHG